MAALSEWPTIRPVAKANATALQRIYATSEGRNARENLRNEKIAYTAAGGGSAVSTRIREAGAPT